MIKEKIIFILYFFFVFIFITLMKFFKNKFIALLLLEGLMMVSILIFQNKLNLNSFSFLLMMIFSLMMVLDSVFGVSILISSSRSMNFSNKFLN